MHLFRSLSVTPALLALACAGPEDAPCSGVDGIIASEAWVRAAEDGRRMSAAYVELCNGGAEDRLVNVQFAGADAVEIHVTTIDENGVAKMQLAADGVILPASQSVALAPGGAHIMLIGLEDALTPGEEAAITLEFEHASPQTLIFEVRSLADAAAQSRH